MLTSVKHPHFPDSVIEDFYEALFDDTHRSLSRMHIPCSDVFYTRSAIYEDTGNWYSLSHVEEAMFLEGWLKASDCYNRGRSYCDLSSIT